MIDRSINQSTVDMNIIPEEWKSLFPISSVFKPPLLLSNPSLKPILGPLIFNPKPNSAAVLFSSSCLLPHLPPLPHLSLPRFLLTSSPDSAPLPSTSHSIASLLGPHNHKHDVVSSLLHNRLEVLQCPQINTIVVFFPTGQNSDQVGFLQLVLKDSTFGVKADESGEVLGLRGPSNYRISRISVNPVPGFSSSRGNDSSVTIGYLLASTLYSVQWFTVKVGDTSLNLGNKVSLSYLGSKVFKTCCVVHASWSPHLQEESVVLLENGALFLFDLESRPKTHNFKFKGTRLKVVWDNGDVSSSSRNYRWLSCEFSWHPRVLIVARSDAVFLVDLRSRECSVTCLMKIEMLHMYVPVEKEQFLVLSRTASDDFHFVLASDTLLLLCDLRKPLMPVLQWAHGLDKPSHLDVFRLSELRSHSREDMYKWASDSGFCIVMGSFWNCQFNTFCYGPSLPTPIGSVASKVAELRKSFYAWELPSDVLLPGHECHCGNCILREEFVKDALPEWVDWQQKKEIVLGFGIVNKELSSLLSEPDEFGGFTLIRLMSSGKLELQRYCASWDPVKKVEESHGESLYFKDYFLDSLADEEYKFPRRFKYLKLDYLCAYLNDKLDEVLDTKMKVPSKIVQGTELFSPEYHELLCKKLRACGFGQFRSSPAVTSVLNDISLPTSIHEVVLKRLWSELPMELLQLAFSNYPEILEVLVDEKRSALEFSAVPDQSQLPPFILRKPSCRSSKWSQKVKPGDALVGPVLPLPILLTLHELRNGCLNSQDEQSGKFSVEAEISRSCNEIMQVASEMTVSKPDAGIVDEQAGSLANAGEETWRCTQKPKPFFSYHPVAGTGSPMDHVRGKSVFKDDRFDTVISKVSEKKPAPSGSEDNVGLELFDDLYPVELKFDASDMKFKQKELSAYNVLKKQFVEWQNSFDLYKESCSHIESNS
ncbi:hypothetical protein ACFX2I_031648 [Malus domestica]